MSPTEPMNTSDKKIKTRFAPSPTGPLHIGGARTALFNWLFARQRGGEFILRIEDTDLERSDPRFEKDIIDGLSWLGLNWDNDKILRQTDRLDIYEKNLFKLLAEGKAFWCPHSTDELAQERERQMSGREAPRHVCEFRDGGAPTGTGIIRLKNDYGGDVKFGDMIRGEVSFSAALLGDFSLAKGLRVPLYNFAVVVDDYYMAISHVIRGEDHIPNTPKQILIQKALGFDQPQYAHLPLILGKDRSKLSKREGAVSVVEYKKDGYLPEAVFNFLVLLGWHPETDKEIFSKQELLKEFTFDRSQKAGAIFDTDKLNWINKVYIKELDNETLAEMALDFLPEEWRSTARENKKWWEKIVVLEKERITKLSEIADMVEYFFKDPFYERELLRWKDRESYEDILRHLKYAAELIVKLSPNFGKDELEAVLMPYAEANGRGDVLWPLRVALCGKRHSPGPFEIAEALGRDAVLKRLESAIKYVS